MYITKKIQQELFDRYDTPSHVRLHCDEVARVAALIAEMLNQNGYSIDVEELYGAALVHDMVRVEDNHDVRGSEILREMNLDKEAELVRRHMTYFPFNRVESFTAIDVLCLSDRVVKEDRYVGLDERMQYLIDKPGKNVERTERIMKAKEHTQRIIDELEAVMKMSLDELCHKEL